MQSCRYVLSLLIASALLVVTAGCGSQPTAKRPDAAGDALAQSDGLAEPDASSDMGGAATRDTSDSVEEIVARDATGVSDTPFAAGDAIVTRDTTDASDTPFERGDTGPVSDASPDQRPPPDEGAYDLAPLADLASAVDSVVPLQDAPACTAAQEARRAIVYESTIIPYADTPEVVRDFLTAFLSVSYIEEHFRFCWTIPNVPTDPALLYFYFVDGCYTITTPGQIHWDVPVYEGKVHYIGPSREWRVLISEEEARVQVEAAGCSSSNLWLTWGAEQTPIPGANEVGGFSYYPVWLAGGESVDASPGMPPGTHCSGPVCYVHAATGALLSQSPGLCGGPL